jgi:hypothetical protein
MAGRLKVKSRRDLDSYNFNPAIRAQIEAKLREQGVITPGANAGAQSKAQHPKGGKRIPLPIMLAVLGFLAFIAIMLLTHPPGGH